MKKDLAVIFGLFAFIVVLMIFGRSYTSMSLVNRGTSTQSAQLTNKKIAVSAKTLNIQAEVAATDDERKKGLSKYDSLGLNEGMLFVFDKADSYVFWMKDMKFAIDIIWISEDKKIVDIAQNVRPEPGKSDDELTPYKPSGIAKYVLEINAGMSSLNGLKPGDSVNFQL